MSLFPFVSRARYDREVLAARGAERWAIDHANELEQELDAARQVQRFQIGKRAEAENNAERTHARNKALQEENTALREQVAILQSRSALTALDAEYEELEQKHHRAKHRIVRYVTELRDLRRRVELHHTQVDAAFQLDSDPRIAEGADWQARRPDKATPAPAAAGDRPTYQRPRYLEID